MLPHFDGMISPAPNPDAPGLFSEPLAPSHPLGDLHAILESLGFCLNENIQLLQGFARAWASIRRPFERRRIRFRVTLPRRIPIRQMTQLDRQDRCLQRVQTGVVADAGVFVFSRAAVVVQFEQAPPQFGVIGGDGATVSISSPRFLPG